MKNIIFDCDPGHDDAFAILVALANPEKVNVKAITTVAGNSGLINSTRNAQVVLQVANRRDIPVYEGCSEPLTIKRLHAEEFHGVTGMDGPKQPSVDFSVKEEFAVDYLGKTLLKEKITIVAIGPLTNIAKVFRKYPEAINNVEEIVIMGGGRTGGNFNSAAEFNFAADPHAADEVLKLGKQTKITLVDFSICEVTKLLWPEAQRLNNNGPVSKFGYELMEFYFRKDNDNPSVGYYDHAPVYDVLTSVYLLHPEYFETKRFHVEVETEGKITSGMTIYDERNWVDHKPHENVLGFESSNREAIAKFVVDSLIKLDKLSRG